ncbi:hypothetical protein [Pseudodesulfovibrio sp.]|uniref:hypothetical protein n=1 Tax=unclassified Pseudodesulfovibrio TaxID=2661612 RepID=UPI003B0036C8
MTNRNQKKEDALNKISRVAATLFYIAANEENTDIGAILHLLGTNLEECVWVLEPPSNQ